MRRVNFTNRRFKTLSESWFSSWSEFYFNFVKTSRFLETPHLRREIWRFLFLIWYILFKKLREADQDLPFANPNNEV